MKINLDLGIKTITLPKIKEVSIRDYRKLTNRKNNYATVSKEIDDHIMFQF